MSLDVFSSIDPEVKRQKDANDALDAFARMLAAENIVVVRGSFHTASFDIKNRVCRIPNWKDMSHSLQVLFRAHEMGHALYTAKENFHEWVQTKPDTRMFSYFNIVEDVRIERRIQSQFPGLTESFNTAYGELLDRSFFGDIFERDMIFIDRINVNTKLGDSNYPMTFKNDRERELYARLQFLSTFDDAMALAEEIFEYAITDEPELDNQNESDQENSQNGEPQTQQGGVGDGDDEPDAEDGDSDAEEGESDAKEGEPITDKLFRGAESDALMDNAPINDLYDVTEPIIMEISKNQPSMDVSYKDHVSSCAFSVLKCI